MIFKDVLESSRGSTKVCGTRVLTWLQIYLVGEQVTSHDECAFQQDGSAEQQPLEAACETMEPESSELGSSVYETCVQSSPVTLWSGTSATLTPLAEMRNVARQI